MEIAVYDYETDTQEIVEMDNVQLDIPIEIQINELKKQLADTDYKAIKYAEGQISEEDYAQIKQQRQTWRDEINNLEQNLI